MKKEIQCLKFYSHRIFTIMLHNFCQILPWKKFLLHISESYIAILYSIVMDLTPLKACVPLGYLPWCKISGEHTFLLLQSVLSLMTSLFSFLQTVPSQGLCVTCTCVLDLTDVAIHSCSKARDKKNFLQLLSSLWQVTFLSFFNNVPSQLLISDNALHSCESLMSHRKVHYFQIEGFAF